MSESELIIARWECGIRSTTVQFLCGIQSKLPVVMERISQVELTQTGRSVFSIAVSRGKW